MSGAVNPSAADTESNTKGIENLYANEQQRTLEPAEESPSKDMPPSASPMSNGTPAKERAASASDVVMDSESVDRDLFPIKTKLTVAQRVDRAASWLAKHLDIESDFKYLFNLGQTCRDLNDDKTAISYFKKAKEVSGKDDLGVLISLARSHLRLKIDDKSITYFQEALDIFRKKRKMGGVVKDEIEGFGERYDMEGFRDCFKDLAFLYDKTVQWEKSISLHNEALEVNPSDVESRFALVKVLCKAGQAPRAIEILEDWSEHAENYGGKRLSDSLYDLMETSSGVWELKDFVRAI